MLKKFGFNSNQQSTSLHGRNFRRLYSFTHSKGPESLNIGYWILDIGYWILDIGYWILDIGYSIPSAPDLRKRNTDF